MSNINPQLDNIGFQMFAPADELKPYIQCYWFIYKEDEPAQPVTQKIVPDGGMGIVFNFGDDYFARIGNNIRTFKCKCVLTGPSEETAFLELSKKIDAIGIRFQPGGAYPFFQEEISNFTDKTIPMSTQDTWRSEELYSSLKMAKNQKDKVSLLNDFLLDKLRGNTIVPSLWISSVVEIVRQHNGSMKIDELARQLNITRRHLDRRFKKEVGLSPKQFSKIIRIGKARYLMRCADTTSLTDVGYDCNYYDQAHFVREFKEVVKETPKEYSQRKKRMSRLYNS